MPKVRFGWQRCLVWHLEMGGVVLARQPGALARQKSAGWGLLTRISVALHSSMLANAYKNDPDEQQLESMVHKICSGVIVRRSEAQISRRSKLGHAWRSSICARDSLYTFCTNDLVTDYAIHSVA